MLRFAWALLIAGQAFWLANVRAAAQPNFIVTPAPEGLPRSVVISLCQTRDGYLWAGTTKGLARFDGHGYETYNEGNTPGLKGDPVVCLFEDSTGGLWVGTDEAVTLITHGLATNRPIQGGYAPLRAACEDQTGAIWLYLADGRLLRCRNLQIENTWLVDPQPSINRFVRVDRSGQVWVSSDSQLARVRSDLNANQFGLQLEQFSLPGRKDFLVPSQRGGIWEFAGGKIYHVTTENGAAFATVFAESYPWGEARVASAIEMRSGALVVGTIDHQAFWLNPDGTALAITNLSAGTALALCEDREGNLWIGTDGGGLDRVKRSAFQIADRWLGNVVKSISADTNGGLWFGFNGGGAVYWHHDLIREYGPNEGLGPNFSAVLVDHAQNVWVGDRGRGLSRLFEGRFQPVGDAWMARRDVAVLCEDRRGNIWVGTDAGLAQWNGSRWRWFTTQNGLTANQITALAEDADGKLWIGTKRSGLNCLQDEKFSAVHPGDGLPSENITALFVDANNVLWVGTGNGLGCRHDGHWSRFTKQDGLASDSVSYLVDDEQDQLWVGSNLGLMRIPKKSLLAKSTGKTAPIPCRVYGEREGLPNSECTEGSQPAACRTSDGRIWFSTIRGLVSVQPASLSPNTNVPLVVIESILLDDAEQLTNRLATTGLTNLIIPATVERLEITYSSLNLAAPDRARFSYWLEGHEQTWNSPTDRRTVSFSRLPPKDYHFRLRAGNEDGVWNLAGIDLAITVLPPFWQTWWFRTCFVAGLIALIAGTVYLIATQKLQRQLALMRQQEALEKERARIARDLHDQLGANLTQVALLGEMVGEDKHLPQEVESHAQQICQTARTTSDALDEIVWAANPANDTLEGLVNYACKYAQDYLALADLRYRLDVPPQLPAIDLPPDLRHNVFLAFKESVNNVVKHARATEVTIRLRLEAGKFLIEIVDNGRGPAEAATKTGRNGLRNMRKRMEDVGGGFEMSPGTERGTIVRLTAPLTKH